MVFNRILLITLIIIVIYTLIIILSLPSKPETKKESPEEREKTYLKLLNMTTQEILLFKNKKDFIDTIKQYDSIKYFLKGTEEENIQQLIKWYYPGYKKL